MNITSTHQETMRKQWLYAYFGGIAIFIITSIIKTLQSPEGFFNYIRTVTIGDQAPQVTYPPLPLTSLIFKICFVPCFYIGIWYLVYRAVYKKQGTRMLLFMMVANAYYGVLNAQQLLGFIRQCILIYFAMDGYAMMLNALWIFYYIIATGVAIWLMNASAKLYTINGMLHQENDV